MVQPITPDLTDLLKSRLQAADHGFRGYLELDYVVPGSPLVAGSIAQSIHGSSQSDFGNSAGCNASSVVMPAPVAIGDILVFIAWYANNTAGNIDPSSPDNTGLGALGGAAAWTHLGSFVYSDDPALPHHWSGAIYAKVANGTGRGTVSNSLHTSAWECYEVTGCTLVGATVLTCSRQAAGTMLDVGALGSPTAGLLAFMGAAQYTGDIGPITIDQLVWTTDTQFSGPYFSSVRPYWLGHKICDGSPLEAEVDWTTSSHTWCGMALLLQPADSGIPESHGTAHLPVTRISLDRSRKMAAAQLDFEITNELDLGGYYQDVDGVLLPNNPCRAYEWYGDLANAVQTFTGLLDRNAEHRDPKGIALTARSRMKWLLEQAPVADITYTNAQVSNIVTDLLDRAGWPSADRAITATSYVVASYTVSAGTSWADAIAGSNRLTTLVGYDLWDDELGVIHFEPSPLTAAVEPAADYTLASGVDVVVLDHEADDTDRKTRVKVTGPLTAAVPSWKLEWETTELKYPVGSWYRASDAANLHVVDAVTKYIYHIRQSDRKILSQHYIGGSVVHPLGLSGDPVDSTIFWVLEADWRYGSDNHAKVHKFRVSDFAHLASYSLPDGQWSDLKSDGVNLWLTNYGDGKLYKRSLTATAVASYTIVYASVTQIQATGLYIDGTTIGLFFAPFERFLLVDSSAPTVITGRQSTAGTHIAGGEIDTTTHADLYAQADSGSFGQAAGYVWKFQLTTLVTTDVVVWATNQALEDALGFQSGIADRVHDLHPAAPAHPWEARVADYAMTVVNSIAQAQATADAQLAELSRIRRVLDLGILGNPALQINDVLAITEPVANLPSLWVLDTYRSEMAADGTYITSFSALPWVAP